MSAHPSWYGDPTPAQDRALRELAALPSGGPLAASLASEAAGHLVSAIIPTYNRCPFNPADRMPDNPLYWAVATLRGQEGGVLAEIIVADDGSQDHTSAVLERLAGQDHPVPVRVIRQDHAGAWQARNAAASAARHDLLYFADDDCVFPACTVAGAVSALALLREQDPAAAAVSTPFYYRSLRPRAVLPASRIGRLDVEAATFSTGFHAVPSGFLGSQPPLLGPSGLLMPLRVQLIGGTALIDAAALRAAGGFADLSGWASGYSDHLHLSSDLAAAGAHLYHCPDPRLGAAHLKFGAAGAYRLVAADLRAAAGTLGRPLGELVSLSAVPRAGSGHRVADGEFFREQIGSFFAFFAARSAAGGLAWAVRSWQEFAVAGQVPTLAVSGVPGPAERARAWRDGLAAGARALTAAGRGGPGRDAVAGLMQEVSDVCGQPPVTGW